MIGDPPATLSAALRRQVELRPDAPAVVVSGRPALSYRELARAASDIGAALRRGGLGRRSRIGIMLTSGSEAAVLNIAVASHAIAAPLNPELTVAEFEEQAAALRLDAIALSGLPPIAEAARRRGIPALRVAAGNGACVRVTVEPRHLPIEAVEAQPSDIALLIGTSGTTGRPKLVPATHANLAAMARRVQHWFGLTSGDRGLCLLPLHYSHGLKQSVLLPMFYGGSVACFPAPPSLDGFLDRLGELAPTWCSTTPTHLRRILELARSEPISPHALRFIQCGAAAPSEEVRRRLEDALGVPVLEGYGLSEAGLIVSNALPPGRRMPGTVGVAPPGEVRIIGDADEPLGAGAIGEILLRGPSVMPGYLDDAAANREAFTADGWFRTGDLGAIDTDGFLAIHGRIKELINRGGEKVSPAEIDRTLLLHPAVVEAAAFGIPHPRLGEDVAAAVVLRAGRVASPAELRRFLRGKLAPFKLPRRIIVVDRLPRADSGKVERARLREILSANLQQPVSAATGNAPSRLEAELAGLWRRLLNSGGVGIDDDFFDKGGDSLLAEAMLLEIERLTGRTLPATVLFETTTVRGLARLLGRPAVLDEKPLIALQSAAAQSPPFFYFPDGIREGSYYLRRLARLLGSELPVVAVTAIKAGGRTLLPSIEQMAARHASSLVEAQPHGPMRLGGFCSGALVAFETARRLRTIGRDIELLALIDPPSFAAGSIGRALYGVLSAVVLWCMSHGGGRTQWLDAAVARSRRLPAARLLFRLLPSGRSLRVAERRRDPESGEEHPPNRLERQWMRAVQTYVPKPASVPLIFFAADNAGAPWRRLARQVEIVDLDCDHLGCLTTHLEVIADRLCSRLRPGDGAPAETVARLPG